MPVSLLVLILALSISLGQDPFQYSQRGSCPSSTSYYDPSSLSCQSCPLNSVSNHDQSACICASGYHRISAPDISPIVCSDCISQAMVASQDRTRCIPCNSSTSAILNPSKRECTCPSALYALADTTTTGRPLSSKQCVLCPWNSYSTDISPHTCMSCPDPNMILDTSTLTCSCISGYTQYQQRCISNSQQSDISSKWPANLAAVKQFRDIAESDSGPVQAPVRLTSAVILDQFLPAAASCKFSGDTTSCQCLLNLCVLQLYDPDSPPCSLFQSIASAQQLTLHEFRDWKYGMPLGMFSDNSILRSSSLSSEVALSGPGSHMDYMIVSYYLNGTLADIKHLTNELQLCPQSPDQMTEFTLFGTRYDNQCWISLSSLVSVTDPLFYDLYYVDNERLYPVPVKILNYRRNNALVNMDASTRSESITSDIQLHHRFIIADTISGRLSLQSSLPKVFSFAVSVELRVEMQYGSSSRIYPPLLIVKYTEREITALDSSTTSSSLVLFRAQYSKDLTGVWTGGNAVFVCVMLAIAALLVLHLWRLYINSDLSSGSSKLMMNALIEAIAISSNLLFWMIWLFSAYFLLFFKFQKTAFVLLPLVGGAEEQAFTAAIIFVFCGKVVVIIRELWRQINVDIFFIDWEKPKQQLHQSGDLNSNVSVWRKLFVANEWNEIATIRLVNIELVLLALLFLLRGINLEYLSSAQPSLALTSTLSPVNIILRFALTATFILLLALLQVVYRRLIHHRFFTHDIVQFVDFMTMCNISAFVLDTDLHGYYIHGRTLHAFADATMEEITRQLRMERKEMVKNRGLVNGKDTFEVFVTPDFRLHYQSIFREIAHHRISHHSAAVRNGPKDQQQQQQQQLPVDNCSEALLLAQADAKLNRFLRNFIDQNSSSYKWAESQRTFVERVFDMPPPIRGSKLTLFYDDPDYRFTSLYLMGIEYDIVTFLIALYAVCDLAFNSTFVSVFIVFGTNRVLGFIRQHWGQINISKKTLVDERFLL